MRTLRPALLATALVTLVASSAAAQNMLSNPDFDTDLSGWTAFGEWDPDDAMCVASSGSTHWVNAAPSTAGALFAYQCVDVPAATSLEARGWVRLPSGQTGSGIVYVDATFYSAAGCSGDFVANYRIDLAAAAPWTELVQSLPPRPDAASVRFAFGNQKYGAGEFETFGDRAWLGRPLIFRDGFECGTPAAWSSTVP